MSLNAIDEKSREAIVEDGSKIAAITLELADSVHFLFDTLSALPQAALVLSKEGKVKYVNHNMLRLLGKAQQDCLGKAFDSNLLDDFSAELARQLLNAVTGADQGCLKRDLLSGRRQGVPFTAEMTLQRLTSTSGELRGILLLLEEQTKTTVWDEKEETAASMDDKEIVTAGISHQLRNNLQSVQSIVELLAMGSCGAFLPDEYCAMLRRELADADYMLTEMLNLARWQKIDLKELSLNEFCQDIVKLIRASLILKPVAILEQYGADLPLFHLDIFRLKQVLLNLLRNALDAVDGKGTITITTSYDHVTSLGKIEIRDSGCGMDSVTLEKIRRPFFTTKERGNGLGLLVCRRLLADQGAYLNITSKQGEGSVFAVMLPLA